MMLGSLVSGNDLLVKPVMQHSYTPSVETGAGYNNTNIAYHNLTKNPEYKKI